MNRTYTLPIAFALTLHAFVFLGLSGKPPAPPVAPEVPPPPLERPPQKDWVEVAPVPTDDEGETEPTPAGSPVRRLVDVPVIGPLGDPFVIAPLPPEPGMGPSRTIPIRWEMAGRGVGRTGIDVSDIKSLDHEPRARVQPAPDYPYELRSRGIEGTVMVEFLVDESGAVYNAVVLRATTPGFEEAVLRAVGKWKFEPGLKHNRPVRFRMSVPVIFSIDRR